MHEPAGVVENLVQILQNTPILQDSFRIPPPPPENENCQRSWHFDFSVSEYPPQLKFRQILGLWVFSVTEYPPPPENWNLGRSWDFEYFQLQNTPPQIKI